MKQQFGKKIKKIREMRGYTQNYLATKLGISQEQYSYIENKQKHLSEEKINCIANILGVSPNFLLNFDPDNIIAGELNSEVQDGLHIHKLNLETFDKERYIYIEFIIKLKEEIAELRNQLKSYTISK